MNPSLAALIDARLPQTQCTRCGYPRCRAYAEALARGETGINRCPPGGDATIAALARLLDRPVMPLDASCGSETGRHLAFIDEELCIGCRKCIDVCPVDAIVGARRFMHTVIARECSGCELCLAACPVDCIGLTAVARTGARQGRWHSYGVDEADNWRQRNEARLSRRSRPRNVHPAEQAAVPDQERAQRRAEIRAAVERVHRRKQATPPPDRQPTR
ncbi:MAG: RnfABCDGE type electron transport complex subunit B [Acidiferrobacterales bacterium]